jgi:hypothetical protein
MDLLRPERENEPVRRFYELAAHIAVIHKAWQAAYSQGDVHRQKSLIAQHRRLVREASEVLKAYRCQGCADARGEERKNPS